MLWNQRANAGQQSYFSETSGGVTVLLTIVTCGIYGIYWAYQAGQKLNQIKTNLGRPIDTNVPILYLILSLFGFSIITYALLQNELNHL